MCVGQTVTHDSHVVHSLSGSVKSFVLNRTFLKLIPFILLKLIDY